MSRHRPASVLVVLDEVRVVVVREDRLVQLLLQGPDLLVCSPREDDDGRGDEAT